jgi:hypothetical protein
MAAAAETARDLIDDDLRSRPKCERDIGDENG